MLTYEQINHIIIDELENIGLWANEVIYTDLDAYVEAYDFLGREPNVVEMYVSTTLSFGEIGGQCLAGQLGELMRQRSHDAVVQMYGEHRASILEDANFGFIWYYLDNLVRSFVVALEDTKIGSSDDAKNEAFIRRAIRATVAHERRHSVQPASLYEEKDWMSVNIDEYFQAAHESDAHAFELAVFYGEDETADINNPASWHPERLVA